MSQEEQSVRGEKKVADATLYVPASWTVADSRELVERVQRHFDNVIVQRATDVREPGIYIGANDRFYTGSDTLRTLFE